MALVDRLKGADDLWAEIKDVDPRKLSGEASADYWAKRLRMRELELRSPHSTDPAQAPADGEETHER